MQLWIVKHTNAQGFRQVLKNVPAANNKMAAAWAEQRLGPGLCFVVINANRLAERAAA